MKLSPEQLTASSSALQPLENENSERLSLWVWLDDDADDDADAELAFCDPLSDDD
jgi:hypothetical protein